MQEVSCDRGVPHGKGAIRGGAKEAQRQYIPGESKAGLALLKRTAALGSVEAHVSAATAAYDYGTGSRPNRRLALRHYQIAAN